MLVALLLMVSHRAQVIDEGTQRQRRKLAAGS
jgi:hypothetical protein